MGCCPKSWCVMLSACACFCNASLLRNSLTRDSRTGTCFWRMSSLATAKSRLTVASFSRAGRLINSCSRRLTLVEIARRSAAIDARFASATSEELSGPPDTRGSTNSSSFFFSADCSVRAAVGRDAMPRNVVSSSSSSLLSFAISPSVVLSLCSTLLRGNCARPLLSFKTLFLAEACTSPNCFLTSSVRLGDSSIAF